MTTTTVSSISLLPAASSSFLLFQSKLSSIKSPNHPNVTRKISSCNLKIDRRNLLVGFGAVFVNGNKAMAMAPEFPAKLDRAIRTTVSRPKKSRSKKEKEDEEEILVIEGIEVQRDLFVKFDVYINDEDDPVSGPDDTEFAGSFVNVPQVIKQGKKKTTSCLRLGLTDLLEDLGVDDDDTVVVTLVPRSGADNVTIGGIKIEFAV